VYCLFWANKDVALENYTFPSWAKFIGWSVVGFGLAQIPLFAYSALYFYNFKISEAFRPKPMWGPENPDTFDNYLKFLTKKGYIAEEGLPTTTKATVLAKEIKTTTKTAEKTAPDTEDQVITKAKFREAAIRRMSVALGHTPNELRKAALLHQRRKSHVPAQAAESPPAKQEPEEKNKDMESLSAPKESPTSPPVLDVEFLPPEPASPRRLSHLFQDYGPLPGGSDALRRLSAAYTDADAARQRPSVASLLIGRRLSRLPPEFAGLEDSDALVQKSIQNRPSVSGARRQIGFAEAPTPPTRLAELKRRLSLMPPRNIEDIPDPSRKASRGILGPTDEEKNRPKRAGKGRISIAVDPEHDERPSSSAALLSRRLSSRAGETARQRLLRRPSMKLTVLEPIESDSDDPEAGERMVADQVERALTNLRRKSLAMPLKRSSLAARKASMAASSAAGLGLTSEQLRRILEASAKGSSEGQSSEAQDNEPDKDQ
ncbi:unnamed protein product, partial [Ixodes hexagonus]